ncbi:MAG: hypothetical protein ACKO2G_04605 [Verrucomicrobiales bacterium]
MPDIRTLAKKNSLISNRFLHSMSEESPLDIIRREDTNKDCSVKKMQTTKTISESQIDEVLTSIFASGGPIVKEAYSGFDQPTKIFPTLQALREDIDYTPGQGRKFFYYSIYYPEANVFVLEKRVDLKPGAVKNHTHRFSQEGWGLICLQITFKYPGAAECRIALIKLICVSLTLFGLCLARLAYVHSHSTHTKEAVVGEALDPLNIVAVFGLYGFGAATCLLLLTLIFAGSTYLFQRPRRSRHEPPGSTLADS